MKTRKTVFFFAKSFEVALPGKIFLMSKVAAALVLITFMVSAHVAVAGPHPNMYLNQAEIDTIRDKVSANVQPWAGAYSKVISAANSALNKSPLSVTFQGKTSSQYFTEKPYCGWPDGCRDGQINPNADRGDYTAAIQLSNAVRDLGLAYAFTGEARYADKAIEMIRVWSLNSGTRMKPTSSAGNRIELLITLPGYFYGADLIWNYGGWDAGEKAAFASWVKAVGDHAKAYGAGLNNFANWRVVLIASAGALLDDNTLLNFAAAEWKRLLPLQMSGNGKMGMEIGRTQGLHYSLYAINAMIQGAEILRHRNVNLYDYRNSGKSLELALDYITPYAINPNSWPYQQIRPITERNSMALYELAYSYYKKPLYLDAINRWTRPLDEIRVMGINTLTHANQFDLVVTLTAPSIVTQPDAVTVAEGENASFHVVSSGSGPLTYQWFRDGSRIPGATDASYTVTDVSSSDNGSVYNCDVSNSLGSVSSSGAVLRVLSDSTAPTLVSAIATSDTRVDIVFSEPVSVSSAEAIGNYQIDLGIGVTAATLNNDGRTVSLTVSQLTADTAYTVLVSDVQDVAQGGPNTIVVQSSQRFTYRIADGFEDGTADGWTSLVAASWRVVMDEGDMAYYLNTTNFSNRSGGRLGEYSLLPGKYGDFTFTAQAKLGDDVTKNAFADYAVIFGYQDSNNYYFMLFNNEQSATQLFKVINGNRTVLATVDSDWLNDNAYHSIEINRKGGAISVRFDDNVILSANDTSLSAGKVGVGSYNDSAYFDDVSVVDPVSGVGSGGGSPTNDGPIPKTLPDDDFTGDDFNGTSLDLAEWTFVDPVGGSTASVGSGQLTISVSGGLPHNIWNSGNNSVRVTHATANQDFFAEVKFDSTPDQKYQLQGVSVEQDANNFIRFDFYSDGNNLKIFAAIFQAGQPTVKVNTVIPTGGPLYMRIKREGNQWTQEYSYDGSKWQTAVSFAHALTVASTNLFAGNAGENVPAFTARIDYYRTDAQ